MVAAIELVFAATAAGLTINVAKCRLGPSTRAKYLGIVIDGVRRMLSLPSSRIERIRVQLTELRATVSKTEWVSARSIAQLVGLLWAMVPCCPRAVALMARGMVAILASAMAKAIWGKGRPATYSCQTDARSVSLRAIMAAFWDGYVRWSFDADFELRFWELVRFARLEAPISTDTLEVLASNIAVDASKFDTDAMTFLTSDAAVEAGGGGQLRPTASGWSFCRKNVFFSRLPRPMHQASSTLREITIIFWMLVAMAHVCRKCVVVFTDSWGACAAIKRGSSCHDVQEVARNIFLLALRRGLVIFPCWLPREHAVMREADRRSRWVDPHPHRTPAEVFVVANNMAVRHFGRGVSFDRQATHMNVMPPPGMGPPLPFNARWHQPGCAGVDMFLQPVASWRAHVNYIYPAAPTTGRVFTFLREVGARAIVVCKADLADSAWWANYTREGGPGVLQSRWYLGFLITAVDHSCRSRQLRQLRCLWA